MMLRRCLFPLFAALMLAACTDGDRPAPIPRPRAYPRPTLYPEAYRSQQVGALTLQINDSARFEADSVRPEWFNIVYPAYGITVNCTLTPVNAAGLHDVLGNRTERMARNVDGTDGELISGPGTVMLVAHGALRTPVQFLATDSLTYVLSGAAVADWPADAPTDSVRPYVDALAADLTFMLRQLPHE